PVWREIARLLHELRPAGGALTLLVPRAVAGLPGVREALAQFAGCELVGLPAGFAAAATSLLDLTPRGATEPVRLLRRLPSGAEPALAALVEREGAQLLLLDHSRFGSFVNGERVAERVRVRAGDEVRIGDPGVALTLIAVADTPPGSRG